MSCGSDTAITAKTSPTEHEGTVPNVSFGWTKVERRQLSILSVDLIGSTLFGAGLEPEEFGNMLGRYQAICTQAILKYGGDPARFIGDGVLAYFGYPQAHEDDAERAVHAALAIIANLVSITFSGGGLSLQLRIGIATGVVVVGEIVRGLAVSQGEVFGTAVALATRLQALASANTILIDESTRLQIGGRFHLTTLAGGELKGFEGERQMWRVDGVAAQSRFDARHSNAPVRLVGREAELGLLYDRWNDALAGEGQVVLVTGEAGIGKSALLHTFDDKLDKISKSTLTLSCIQFHQDTAAYPVIVHLARAAMFDDLDGAERKRQKLTLMLRRFDNLPLESHRAIADTLRLIEPSDKTNQPTPQRRKEETLSALVAYIRAHARQRPLLLRVEDAQWIDPTTTALLLELVETIRDDRILIVITTRPSANLGWLEGFHFSHIVLNRLGRVYASNLIRAVAQRELSHSLVQDIIRKAEGVPLYIEELVTAILRSNQLHASTSNSASAKGTDQFPVPSTLQGLLLERLDRIPSVKDIAQVCAVVGNTFSLRLLTGVLPIEESRLTNGLDTLVQAGLLSRRREFDEKSFTFKHVLMQQAIYDSILISRRRDIHARVASAMETLEARGFQTEPSILAHHYAQALLVEKAIKHLKIAGQRAMRQSAVIEAAALIGRALSLLSGTSRNDERDRMEIELQIAMGQALIAGKGLAFPDVGQAFDRALMLCDALGETAALFPIMLAKCRSHQLRGELRAAAEVAQDFYRRAAGSRDVTIRGMAHRCMGIVFYHDGRLALGIESFYAALNLYDRKHRGSVAFQLVNNPKIVCCIHLSGLLFATGRNLEAEQSLLQAEQELDFYNDSFDAAVILAHKSLLNVMRRNPILTLEVSNKLCLLSDEQGFSQYYALGLVCHGWARAMTGAPGGGSDELERGIALYRRTGGELHFALFEALSAEALALGGQPLTALDRLAAAAARSDDTTESTCGFAAEIHRMAAAIIAAQTMNGDETVIAELDRAIDIAKTQGGVTWEARARLDLAREFKRAGRFEQAAKAIRDLAVTLPSGCNGPDIGGIRALVADNRESALRSISHLRVSVSNSAIVPNDVLLNNGNKLQ